MSPKISIIVPVYNVEKYLNRCIDSILNQTFDDFELILIDDGSTDKSGEICDKYMKDDSRVKVIHQKNSGPSYARNMGLNLANGDYIGFVDSDDWIDVNMYEHLYLSCLNEHSEMSIIGIREVNESNVCLSEYIPSNINLSEILKRAYPCNKLFKKELFENEKFVLGRYYEDLELISKLFIKSKKVSTINTIGYNYLKRTGSTTSSRDSKIIDNIWAYTKIKEYLILNDKYEIYEDEFKKSIEFFKKFYANILYDYPTRFLINHKSEIINYFKMLERITFKEYISFIYRHIIFVVKRSMYNLFNANY